jgi:hypothetical protein
MTLYGALAEAVIAQTQVEEREGMDPQVIAATVLAALRAPKPRERYVIGRKARIQAVAAMLPPSTRDRLVKQVMKLP